MPLSKEQFQELRDKGLSVDQIVRFETGQTAQAPQKLSVMDRAANITNAVFGGGKVGEAIGTQLAKRMVSPEAAQFVSPGPSTREIAGSTLQSASLFVPVGRIAGLGAQASRALGLSRIAKTVGNVGAGAAGGFAFDVASNLQDTSKQGAEVLTPGLGTAIGGAIPGAGAIAGGVKNAVVGFGEKQAPRVINSLIKPLLKDFSYGKNPGRAVAEEGIVANTFEDLEKGIKTRRQEIGQAIGDLGSRISTKSEIQLGDSLNVLTDAMKDAASVNNPTLLARLNQVKQAITENLAPAVDEKGNIVIQSLGSRKLNSLSFPEARDILRDIGDMTQFTGNPSDDKAVNMALKRLYGNIKQKTLDFARKESPELADEFETLTEKYADLSSAEIATKYRDKILERQSLVGVSPQMAGVASGIVTLVATGGAALPAVLVGIGGAALDKLLGSPAFKTRLASLLAKKSTQEVNAIFSKFPALEKYFPKGSAISPGDRVLELGEDLADQLDSIPNKQGGFARNPFAKEGVSTRKADTSAPFDSLSPQQKGMREDALKRAREQGAEITPDGNIVLYHGTDSARAPKEGDSWRVGSYFTTDETIARQFANQGEGKNPIVMRAEIPAHKVFAGKQKDAYWSLNEETPVKTPSPLLQEAKKYKTAEEFVKAQGETLYHGTPNAQKIDSLKSSTGVEGYFGNGVYLSRDKKTASQFTKLESASPTLEPIGDGNFQDINTGKIIKGGRPDVLEAFLSKDIKLKRFTIDEMDAELEAFREPNGRIDLKAARNAVRDKYVRQGYDGFEVPATKYFDEPQTVIFPTSEQKIQLRSQLIDIWKKANNK